MLTRHQIARIASDILKTSAAAVLVPDANLPSHSAKYIVASYQVGPYMVHIDDRGQVQVYFGGKRVGSVSGPARTWLLRHDVQREWKTTYLNQAGTKMNVGSFANDHYEKGVEAAIKAVRAHQGR